MPEKMKKLDIFTGTWFLHIILPLIQTLKIVHYRTIKSLAQYKSYESYLGKLLGVKDKLPSELEKIENLYVATAKDPIERLIGLMEKNKINPATSYQPYI